MSDLSSRAHERTPEANPGTSILRKLWKGVSSEFPAEGIHLRLALAKLALSPLPIYMGSRIRAFVLSRVGFSIGQGTVFYGMPTITGSGDLYSRLTIGHACLINVECFLDVQDRISIGDRVSIGHKVIILTTTHEVGSEERRADFAGITAPVRIEDGVWVGARCVILPGVTIGRGSIVGAGAVVRRDVPPNTLVKDTRHIPIDEWLASKRTA
jgi:maltose O-acetyltransferase